MSQDRAQRLSLMVLLSANFAGTAWAQTEPATPEPSPPPSETPKEQAPPPYSLPFGLRGASPVNVVRVDTVTAFSNSTVTVPVLVFASYKVIPDLAVFARWGVVSNTPKLGGDAFAATNAAIGGIYGIKLTPELRLGVFLGLFIPIGSGGGNEPNVQQRAAMHAGMAARSALDNVMFAANYLSVVPGIDLAYVAGGFTVQLEATTLFLIRARGDLVDKDSFRLNFTAGLHAGYFVVNSLSLAAELRYQGWLKNDTVKAIEDNPAASNVTLAVGPRFHVKASDGTWLRPGISVAVGLDKPFGFGDKGQAYVLAQLDLPLFY